MSKTLSLLLMILGIDFTRLILKNSKFNLQLKIDRTNLLANPLVGKTGTSIGEKADDFRSEVLNARRGDLNHKPLTFAFQRTHTMATQWGGLTKD